MLISAAYHVKLGTKVRSCTTGLTLFAECLGHSAEAQINALGKGLKIQCFVMLAKHIAKIIFIEYKVNLLALDYKIIFMSI